MLLNNSQSDFSILIVDSFLLPVTFLVKGETIFVISINLTFSIFDTHDLLEQVLILLRDII